MRARSDAVRDVFLLILAACGGAFDATSYLSFHAFTANMTANTVLLGLWLGGRNLRDAGHAATAIVAFGAGAFVATLVGEETTPGDPWPRGVVRAFAAELACLIPFAALVPLLHGESRFYVLLALGAGAMGMQSGVTHDIHLSGASTTYMTGTIARTGEKLADSFKGAFRGGFVLNLATWVVYLAAAIGVAALDLAGRGLVPIPWSVASVVAVVALVGRRCVLAARRADARRA